MAVLDVAALLLGVAGAVLRPWRVPPWVAPVLAAVVVIAAGGLGPTGVSGALSPLRAPIGFLLAAVPLAVMLDRAGWFAAVAARLERRGSGIGGLWVLAAVVPTVLNLDAAVVLLTPLYVSVARRRGLDPLTLAVQPVLLACLASAALPVSNLTNLIAASATGATTVQFLEALGLPSLAATATGWVFYRRWAATRSFSPAGAALAPAAPVAAGDGKVLAWGSALVAAVLVGFVAGDPLGIAPWEVAIGADVVLVAVARRVPLRSVPVGTALVALGLGVAASAAAAHLPVARLLAAGGVAGQAGITAVMAGTANVANNLPALLVALPALGHRPSPTLWSVLVGVDMGPVLLATGSLASLLWLGSLERLGVAAGPRDFTAVGVRVGLPAAVAGAATHLALHAAGIG
jgi:arsenical pump membrane protein